MSEAVGADFDSIYSRNSRTDQLESETIYRMYFDLNDVEERLGEIEASRQRNVVYNSLLDASSVQRQTITYDLQQGLEVVVVLGDQAMLMYYKQVAPDTVILVDLFIEQ